MATLSDFSKLNNTEFPRAYEWFRCNGGNIAKVEANPIFSTYLDAIGIDAPVEYKPTQAGIRFLGATRRTTNAEYSILMLDSETFAFFGLDAITEKPCDEKSPVRMWALEHSPKSIQSLCAHWEKSATVWLAPPTKSEQRSWRDWLKMSDRVERYFLPNGWEVAVAT
ncbi:MAG: hypothetical protein HC888_02570 [Candidatus Competibacteraceae bacterium]|nr:hypothetical protein [Candidatus Competibacteraceae bacterium]